MFKKLTSLVLVAIMAFSLVACGAKEAAFSADLEAFYDTIFTDPDNTPAMIDLTMDEITLELVYPGLSEIEAVQLVAQTSMLPQVTADIIMIEVANAEDVAKVKAIFETRIDNQINGGSWYPTTTEVWENQSTIVEKGNYVCLFALDGMETVVANFEALGGK